MKKLRIAKEKAEANARLEKYWEEHADRREKLKTESKDITERISVLNAEISNIPGTREKANLELRINKLLSEKKALSFFKVKEKKAIQEQIDALMTELSPIAAKTQKALTAINAKITPLVDRQKAIQSELTKPR